MKRLKRLPAAVFTVLIFAAVGSAETPTFNKHIAPILYQHCATCHRPGEVAPFSLLTYPDASKRASLIASVTERRYMPPWKAEPGYGHFADERRLTDAQIALIKEWASGGAPEGNPADKPPVPAFADGWQGGKPDRILTMPSKFALAADGPDQFRCFLLPLSLDKDAYVSGLEFRPDNRRIVHHALVFVDTAGGARQRVGPKSNDGSNDQSYPCFGGPGVPGAALIGGWAPGAVPAPVAEDYSRPVPQGSDIIVQIHYHPSGKPESDQSSLGLIFSGPPKKGRTAAIVIGGRLNIPPGDAHYVVKGQLVLPRDVEVASITPHAHYLAKDMKITARLPDGGTVPMIWIKDWDFNWQGSYRYEKPVALPKDTRIELEYEYDNSENNPRNPAHPPVRVKWGEQTTDEMALAFLGVLLPTPQEARDFNRQIAFQNVEAFLYEGLSIDDLSSEIGGQQRARLMQALRLFDRNQNGVLDADERAALLRVLRGNN
ncbi:MAG TPA: ascorbate-dependent monooxygenase [Terriglobia bacterium]|nr:ascorbate-dependent monooxygenase [Terriglobia bacterium]